MLRKYLFYLLCFITCSAQATHFSTSAKSFILLDYDSGTEIDSKKADTLMPPSSMLKLMTLTVVFDELKNNKLTFNDLITVSESADYNNPVWQTASKLCLVKGQKIPLKDALLGIIVLSAGDASLAVAEHIAGTEDKFVELMSTKASSIGLKNSTFGNVSGLPNDNNLMTSRELAKLATYIITEYPELYPLFSTKRFQFTDAQTEWCQQWADTHTTNYNKLLFSMYGADGLKTGHTDMGGYGMVASSKVKGRRLIGVINGFKGSGHEALAKEMHKLLQYGYNSTKTKVFYKQGDKIADIPVWYGRYPTVKVTPIKNVAITVPKNADFKNIRILARYYSPILAPVQANQIVGEIVVEKNGNVINRIPLATQNKVRKIQLFGRLFKNISVMLRGK